MGNKNNLRTMEAQIVQKHKNNDPPPKFTGSYKKASIENSSFTKLLFVSVYPNWNLLSKRFHFDLQLCFRPFWTIFNIR